MRRQLARLCRTALPSSDVPGSGSSGLMKRRAGVLSGNASHRTASSPHGFRLHGVWWGRTILLPSQWMGRIWRQFSSTGIQAAEQCTAGSITWKGFGKGSLDRHHKKHGNEFGNLSQSEYLKQAKDFAAEEGDFQERKVGNFLVKYDPVSRRVLIGHIPSRKIRTFYKADEHRADPFKEAIELARQKSGLSKAKEQEIS